jgi:hypothetical protein
MPNPLHRYTWGTMRDSKGKTIRGKRGGKRQSFDGERCKDIHSRIDGLPSGHNSGHAHKLKGSSATHAIAETAKYFECSYSEETAETHLIPRRSLSRKQGLAFRSEMETAPLATRQITKQRDNRTGAIVEVADELQDNRLTWRLDKTLLRRGNPFQDAEASNRDAYKREGTVSVGLETRKYRESIQNPAPVEEQQIGIALDDDPFVEPAAEITMEELDSLFSDPE